MDWEREKRDYVIKPIGLKEIKYYKCRLCNCGFNLDYGEEITFISEKKETVTHFICDSCIRTIIDGDGE